jgi:hypothetical protein
LAPRSGTARVKDSPSNAMWSVKNILALEPNLEDEYI